MPNPNTNVDLDNQTPDDDIHVIAEVDEETVTAAVEAVLGDTIESAVEDEVDSVLLSTIQEEVDTEVDNELATVDPLGILDGVIPNPRIEYYTSEIVTNVSKLIIVDLDSYRWIWDQDEFWARIQKTSWYVELGPPPIHGAFLINTARDALTWWDREKGEVYMVFSCGGTWSTSTNMIGPSTGTLSGLAWKDAKVFVGTDSGHGLWWVDFVEDSGYEVGVGGSRRYKGVISERNDGKGVITTTTSIALGNDYVRAVDVIRDRRKC